MCSPIFLRSPREETEVGQFDQVLGRTVQDLRHAGLHPLILANTSLLYEAFDRSTRYKPGWSIQDSFPSIKGLEGLYENTWVIGLQSWIRTL